MFLMSARTCTYMGHKVSLLLLQHGESVCNMYGKIGGDSELSERGVQVSAAASWSIVYSAVTVLVLLSSHSVCPSTEGLYERTRNE